MLVLLLAAGSYFLARYNYPLFHSFADMITVFIAASVFLVVWNGRQRLDNHYFLFTGIAFLSFAVLDFMHLLGNKDMGVFPGYGNLGPTFYIASRYVLGFSLLAAPFFVRRKLNVPVAFGAYSAITGLIIASVLVWENLPVTYVEGTGLTTFKVASDYVVCAALLGAIGVLLVNRRAFDGRVLRIIVVSLVLSLATGLAFTLYTDPFGITNLVGHFFQIGSFALIYMAFVETAMTKPQDILYHNLKQSDQEAHRLNAALEKANDSLNRHISEQMKAEEALEKTQFVLSEGQRIAHAGTFEYIA